MLILETRLHGKLVRSQVFSQEKTIRIGRDPRCDVHLSPHHVSRIHAKIDLRSDGIMLSDNGSANGLRVNGERTDQALLRDGDVIEVGEFGICVRRVSGEADLNYPTIRIERDG
jgi:pSer/pThr/pTyr-binding forkhead associated (FHA) protein